MPASGSGPRRRQLSRDTMKQHEYQQPTGACATPRRSSALGSPEEARQGVRRIFPNAATYLRTKAGSCVSETRPMARKFCLFGDSACIKVGALIPSASSSRMQPSQPATCGVTVLMAADVTSCSLLKTAAERTYDRNQDASSDEASNQITDPTGEGDTEEAK